MYLHIGVKRLYTKNVTLPHNYKEKVFPFSSITSIEKLCTEKGAWWRDSALGKKKTKSHNTVNMVHEVSAY